MLARSQCTFGDAAAGLQLVSVAPALYLDRTAWPGSQLLIQALVSCQSEPEHVATQPGPGWCGLQKPWLGLPVDRIEFSSLQTPQ